MMTVVRIVVLPILVAALLGCGQEPAPAPVELSPAEVFTWSGGQPVSFALPPAGWERSRYQNGGTEGVDFVKAGSVGEQILVAERLFLGGRDHCANMQELRRDAANYDRRAFEEAVQLARLYPSKPAIAAEERTIGFVNDALDRARAAHLGADTATFDVEMKRALERASKIRYTLDQTVDRALFTAEANTVYPALEVAPPRATKLAGRPALAVDFTFEAHREKRLGRRIYVVANNRMFEFGYQGRAANLPLFERVVESVTFPPGRCVH